MRGYLKIFFIVTAINILFVQNCQAKIGNTVYQNRSELGKEQAVDSFTDNKNEASFTGYREYQTSNGKYVDFFINGKVRTSHFIPKKILTRSEVRTWSARMFPSHLRGRLRKELKRFRSLNYFFDTGLISYEYHIVKNKEKGFAGIKVLLFENNKKFWQINPKAYL